MTSVSALFICKVGAAKSTKVLAESLLSKIVSESALASALY